jgi:hypothetical protein
MNSIKIVVLLFFVMNSNLLFALDDSSPLTKQEVINVKDLSEDSFKNLLLKHGISFVLDEENKQKLINAGFSSQRLEFIQNEVSPINFITEKTCENQIKFSISNRNNSEVRISQIEIDILNFSSEVYLSLMERSKIRDLVLPHAQTQLITDNQIIDLQPSEMQSFNIHYFVEENIVKCFGCFRFKIAFFKTKESIIRYSYSDKLYCFSMNDNSFWKDKNKSNKYNAEAFTAKQLATLLDIREQIGKMNLAEALIMIGDERGISFSINEYKKKNSDEDRPIRWRIIYMLGKNSNQRVVEFLISIVKEDHDNLTIAQAARALGHIRNPLALESLIAALQNPDSAVQESAINALGELSEKHAIEPLTLMLNTVKEKTKIHALIIDALKKINEK